MSIMRDQNVSLLQQINVCVYIYVKKKSVIAAHNMHAIKKHLFSIGVDFRREHQHFSILYKISEI